MNPQKMRVRKQSIKIFLLKKNINSLNDQNILGKTFDKMRASYLVACLTSLLLVTGSFSSIVQVTSLDQWNLYSTADPTTIYPISVPHTVLGALLDNTSKYPFDPFYGKNLQQISEYDFDGPWVYSTTLNFVDGTRQHSDGN